MVKSSQTVHMEGNLATQSSVGNAQLAVSFILNTLHINIMTDDLDKQDLQDNRTLSSNPNSIVFSLTN